MLAQKLDRAIAAGRFDTPWVRELAAIVQAAAEDVRTVLRKGALQGALYQIVPDLYYHRERVRELSQLLRNLVHRHGAVDAARYRDAIGVGRKRTIQILEFFDRSGYTRRTPKGRVLRIDSSWHDDVR
jgi:selenocysteine-specific elongation factor